ncbi:MAG: hypothetical protein Ta2A_07060 [Treponemataceae bacterium]|nr:MAG: hypothetical protein Ta2A_07060 [Treponemataceae bacterium]
MKFFNEGVESMDNGAEELRKALSAGYGTDEAQFSGGRALEVEDMEAEMIMAMELQPEDAKLLNRIKRRPAYNTVHEYNTRDSAGEFKFLSASEGGTATESDQDIKRRTVEIKYLQTLRGVTDQMMAARTYESALASEKMAGTMTIVNAAEYRLFHGDADVIPTDFDGLPAIIKKATDRSQNIVDLRGQTIGSVGRSFFDEITTQIFQRGGNPNVLFYPPQLAKDIQELAVSDNTRFVGNASFKETGAAFSAVVDHFTSSVGSTVFFGTDAGADKLYQVKGAVIAEGVAGKRPASPVSVALAAQTSVSGSQFASADAGNYTYAVHAINKNGVSEATAAAASVGVTSDGAIQITIAPSSTGLETGYIITRSNKGGSLLMEMVKVPRAASGNTVYVDLNADLPGTAEALWLTERKLQPIVELYQLIPLRYRQLFETDRAWKPFMIQLFAAPTIKAPHFCGLTKNISYGGGLY